MPSKGQRDKSKIEESKSFNDEESEQRLTPTHREPNQWSDPIKAVKIKILMFQGRSNPEAYLEWERKMEMIFESHNYTKE